MALWKTGNVDAQLLATLLLTPKNLSAGEMDRMVRSVTFVHLAEWLNAYVLKQHPDKETLRQEWTATADLGGTCRMEPHGRASRATVGPAWKHHK